MSGDQVRRAVGYGAAVIILLVIAGVAVYYFYGKRKVADLGPMVRARIIKALEDRFNADVDLKSVQVSVYPHPKVVGDELSIRHKGWPDSQPLIYIRRFSAQTDYESLIAKKNNIDLVRLEGLVIRIPHRGESAGLKSLVKKNDGNEQAPRDQSQLRFLIKTIVADGTLLEIESKNPDKPPLQFDIQKLTLHSIAPGKAMSFTCKLTNAKPPGLIDSTGKFGPWQRDDPRVTPVSGDYKFQNADLGVFKGISGILSSTGKYDGVLQNIDVEGTTDTPQFALKRGGEPVHLTTTFHSIVDGTNGDTILNPVDAKFLNSEFVCRGGVLHQGGPNGKTVSLDAVATHARMEDILRLVIGKGKPFLTGGVNFKSKIIIPPGPQDVLNKLKLNGQFLLSSAEFTSPKVEQKIRTLSDRARGISKDEEADQPPQTVASDFQGRFKLNDGAISFSSLSFSVPGAAIRLAGTYNLRSEAIDMSGKFRMDATLSETQSGVKHWLLKPFDRFFEKDGAGLEVPVTVSGTKDHPEIGTEIFHKHVTIH